MSTTLTPLWSFKAPHSSLFYKRTCGGLEEACCFSSLAYSRASQFCFWQFSHKHVLFFRSKSRKSLLQLKRCYLMTSHHEFPACVLNLERCLIGLLSYSMTGHFLAIKSLEHIPTPTHPFSPTTILNPLALRYKSKFLKSFQDLVRSGLCLLLSSSAELNLLLSKLLKHYFSLCVFVHPVPSIWNGLLYLDKFYKFFIAKQNTWINVKNRFYHQVRCSMTFHITL